MMMMMRKASFAMFVLALMLLFILESHASTSEAPAPQPQQNSSLPKYGSTQGSLQPQDCGPQCTRRCSKTQYHKPCMFFCQKCCAKCLCVPSGTYGNKQTCPCYNNWKTKRGGPKCP
ncbi:protein GAST1 [Ricinus communis]|uniref:GAST1 protein, putative n=1 Tax=Ricinus communis TaxID=3988 RepID=B9SVR9_RICCO|nr:protein GAST1 [Ricinus communis]EEF32287.1 GAST1 protein precursor, putative [Ricinus communis]|eukprot:XP_002530088.1 protein GAST1 [Ricinus communis]